MRFPGSSTLFLRATVVLPARPFRSRRVCAAISIRVVETGERCTYMYLKASTPGLVTSAREYLVWT